MATRQFFIGLMTGTSLDGIDAVLVRFDNGHVQLVDAIEHPIPDTLYQQLADLCQPGNNEIERMGKADRQLARCYAHACQQLLKKNQLHRSDISAIGCHGQTIRHDPSGTDGFSLQIGDPNTLTQLTGITTVADFRRRDVAAGGQGAPLAPAFHQATFATSKHKRAIVNIGGMANISLLETDGATSGYDTGPGNILMNAWIEKQQQQRYDDKGQWAASGEVDNNLLTQLLTHPYFSAPTPKSTGRENFNFDWLQQQLTGQERSEDVQATLLEFTAQSIANEVNKTGVSQVYLCGGGAYNTRLVLRLETLLHPITVASTDQLGIAPEWVEAVCFAWLAKQTLEGRAIKTSAITGAQSDQILGAIYQA